MITLWKIWKAIKAETYDKVADLALPLLFENVAVRKFLMRYKRATGLTVACIGFIAEKACMIYTAELPYCQEGLAIWAVIAGSIWGVIGVAHAGSKKRRGIR